MREKVLERLRAEAIARGVGGFRVDPAPLPGSEKTWQEWVKTYFSHVCEADFAERHIRLWEWFDRLEAGQRIRPRVEIWPRGGAKSSTAELGCARVCAKISRRFVLYVSMTQEQTDKHVQSVGSLLEAIGVERQINQYGNSKGWSRTQLRTSNGFNIAGFGLDTGARGVKLDEVRPDLIIFDDIDHEHDTEKTVLKKIDLITKSIIPAGSVDCAVLFLQNLIHEDGIMSKLWNGSADFLHDREPAFLDPAVYNLEVRNDLQTDGSRRYVIAGGQASWHGQNLETCERQINDWGLRAFKQEAQHEVNNAAGFIFDISKIETVDPADVPYFESFCIAGDLAATEAGGDNTVLAALGKSKNGVYYIVAMIAGQWSPDRVIACISDVAAYYKFNYPKMQLRLPQDPGQAGKAQKGDMEQKLSPYRPKIEPVSGTKSARASGFADEVNKGNVRIVKADLPGFLSERVSQFGFKPLLEDLTWQKWHSQTREELRKFKEDVTDQTDDRVDALSDAYNTLAEKRFSLRAL